jgi:hypothetical protein
MRPNSNPTLVSDGGVVGGIAPKDIDAHGDWHDSPMQDANFEATARVVCRAAQARDGNAWHTLKWLGDVGPYVNSEGVPQVLFGKLIDAGWVVFNYDTQMLTVTEGFVRLCHEWRPTAS